MSAGRTTMVRAAGCGRARRARRDDGLVTSAVVVATAVGVLALVFLAVIPLLAGTEQAGRTQTSADAAALAGADVVRDDALAGLGSVIAPSGGVSFGEMLGSLHGYAEAQAYASANGADVIEYRYDPWADELHVRTRLRQAAPNGEQAESEATASIGVQLALCSFDRSSVVVGYEPPPTPTPTPTPGPTPGPTESPTPTPTPTTPPVPIYADEFRFGCPGFDSGASLDLGHVLDGTRSWLEATLEPRLVG